MIHIPVDRYEGVPDYESFWDVPVAEVSEMETVALGLRGVRARTRRPSGGTCEGVLKTSGIGKGLRA